VQEVQFDSWHLDEVFIRINGQQHYLWRAVDQDGDVIDILVQPRRDQCAAERFFRRLLRGEGKEPFRILSDKLRSYSAAMRTIPRGVAHNAERYANKRIEASHQPTRQRDGTCIASSLPVRPNAHQFPDCAIAVSVEKEECRRMILNTHFERAILRERTRIGIASARNEGRIGWAARRNRSIRC
jgi:transposase-like protein